MVLEIVLVNNMSFRGYANISKLLVYILKSSQYRLYVLGAKALFDERKNSKLT